MRKTESLSAKQLMLIGLGVTLTVLLLIAGIAWEILLPVDVRKSAAHGHAVMNEFEGLRSRIDRAEHAQWAYFLTNDKSFLVQRDAGLKELNSVFVALKNLTSGSVLQQERIEQLQSVVDQRLRLFSEGQTIFETQGFNATQPIFEAGRKVTAQAHRVIEAALTNEMGLLKNREGSQSFRLKFIVSSIVLLLIFLLTLAVRIRNVFLSGQVAEQVLQEGRQTLLKTSALQDAIFNSANFSSIATDAKGVIQIFTPADISDPQEVIARAKALSFELGTPITPGFEALVFKAMRGIEDIYELTYIRKDGSRFAAIVSVTALRDANHTVIGFLLIGTDNTARKEVEAEQALLDQRLRDQQFYTRSLIEANIDAIMTTDPRGIISDINEQMEALTGCTRDELIGAPFKDFFTDPERAEAAITRALREGKVTNYELTARARNGKETVVSYNATTFHDRNRKLKGVFAAARDVTERKQFEHALQETNVELETAKAAAEKANLAKSEFLSSMSHELRSPLNAVLGFAQLMASASPPPSSVQKMSIDQILQAGWYLLRLINEILDLAMIESGKVTMSQESMSLTEVLQDCRAMIEPQANKRGLQMTFPSFDVPLYIHADRTRIKQILINLLSNAIKYNRPGGAINIFCDLRDEGRVRISIQDTGVGLGPEQLAQLFQPFNRLGQEASSEEGTGIGLVVTKQLVELLDGSIGVESNVGVGSIFWVEFSTANAPALLIGEANEVGMKETPKLLPQKPLPLRTLLYVEDNPANLLLVEQLIARRNDIKLLTAIDGYLGIQLAKTCQPDVILMDINLPGISGYGALKVLLADPVTAHIPVMALSANAIPRDIVKGLDAGFFRYLTKPIKVDEFMDALDFALQYAAENGLAKNAEKVV